MLKLIYALARKEGLSREEFQRYWREVHGPLVRDAADALGIQRYVQSHSVTTALDESLQASRSLAQPAYDGHAELWFLSEEAMIEALTSPEGQAAAQRLLEDEAKFIDFTKSRMVLARETIVVG
jgi:uncharacterized protein (TIGR02118 family)